MTHLRTIAILFVTATLAAQAQAPVVRSPEVHPDRTVTFRLRAPQASVVELTGEVLQGKGPQPMTRGSDGVWSLTIGPLPPEIWIYNFRTQGVDLPDPSNISLMPRAAGQPRSRASSRLGETTRPSTTHAPCLTTMFSTISSRMVRRSR